MWCMTYCNSILYLYLSIQIKLYLYVFCNSCTQRIGNSYQNIGTVLWWKNKTIDTNQELFKFLQDLSVWQGFYVVRRRRSKPVQCSIAGLRIPRGGGNSGGPSGCFNVLGLWFVFSHSNSTPYNLIQLQNNKTTKTISNLLIILILTWYW